jgi:hypothetical protein
LLGWSLLAIVEMALNEAAGGDNRQRCNPRASSERAPATGMEAAAGRRIKWIGKGGTELGGRHT